MALVPDAVRLGRGFGFAAVVVVRFGRGLVDVDFDLDDPAYSKSEPSSTSRLLARFFRDFGVGLEGAFEEAALCFLFGAGESEW